MNNPFFVPNGDRNCRLEELPTGLRVIYILACPPEYKYKSFFSKKKWYVERHVDLQYNSNMSDRIIRTYYLLKAATMLELATYKRDQLNIKINQLKSDLNF